MATEDRRTRTFFEDRWHEGSPPLISPQSHVMWLSSSVFDGARWFEGLAPDLDRHCARLNRSALAMGLTPVFEAGEVERIVREGLEGFDGKTAVYIRPMYWAEEGGYMGVPAEPASTRFCVVLAEAPMLEPSGFTLALSPFRRPTPETAPTNAKAGCLYPNSGRAILEAKARGFDNALMRDMAGNVAETATSNVFLVKDGVVRTPVPNGCFLAGITRDRVLRLLKEGGRTVEEASLTVADFRDADEVFSTGNHSKVVPVVGFEDRRFEPGPVYREARDAYWAFARSLA